LARKELDKVKETLPEALFDEICIVHKQANDAKIESLMF